MFLREGGKLIAEEYNTLEFEVRDGVAHITLNLIDEMVIAAAVARPD